MPGQMKTLKINLLEAVDVFEQKEKEKTVCQRRRKQNTTVCLNSFDFVVKQIDYT